MERVVYQRYAYWCDKGHFERLFQGVQQPGMEEVMVDSTCCRVHQASAGASKTSDPQAIGITRGGLNTKIHAVCDALGNPLRFVLTAGQRHDSKPVPELLDGLQAKALLADNAYDSFQLPLKTAIIFKAFLRQTKKIISISNANWNQTRLSRPQKSVACRSSSLAGSTAKKKPARPGPVPLQGAPFG
ncbi:MAG: IS5 family transposase [Xanthomonadaceae bacterium]|nr:IS5 family transposase [Xanthomonadaceae bacterium]